MMIRSDFLSPGEVFHLVYYLDGVKSSQLTSTSKYLETFTSCPVIA